MSYTVCVCVPSSFSHKFFRAILGRCSQFTALSGIRLIEASMEDKDLSSKLRTSDVVVSVPAAIGKHYNDLKQVKWAHSIWAGIREVIDKPSPPPFIFTRHVGLYGIEIATYTIAQIINREKGLLQAYQHQLECKWDKTADNEERSLSSLTIGILGVGAIGSKVAEMCKTFGMTTWGLTRTEPAAKCPYIDHHRLVGDLPELLTNSDYVCNILPSTPQTAGLLNGDTLRVCQKKKTVLINVGRGDVISEPVLIKSIREGWLGGAILDVFEQEPLSKDSELWRMPQVVITPHMAARATQEDCANLFIENLLLFVEGKDMKYRVDWTRGY